MPAAAKRRSQKGGHAGPGHFDSDDPGAHREDVGVVVLTREGRRERLLDEGAAYLRVAVDRDGDADAGAAEGDGARRLSGGHMAGEPVAEIRIIDARLTVRTQIFYFVALFAKPSGERSLEGNGGVVGGDGNAHGSSSCHLAREADERSP